MHRIPLLALGMILSGLVSATPIAAQSDDGPSVKRTAQMSEFATKLRTLDQIAGDILLSGALALLAQADPDRAQDSDASFQGLSPRATSDPGAVAGSAEYAMSKLRGAIFRNPAADDMQKDRALTAFDDVKALMALAYALDRQLSEDAGSASVLHHDQIVPSANDIRSRVQSLLGEMEQTIKFSAL